MNWEQRVKRAQETPKYNRHFTKEDKELAKLWITCPISEIADRIEFKKGKLEKGPIDIYLLLDGLYFTKGVEDNNVDLAANCYKAIHRQVEALEAGTDRITRIKEYLGDLY